MERNHLQAVAMERDAARSVDKRTSSLQKVDSSDAYFGVIGNRYGTKVPPEDLSLTELEWRRARERGIPCYFLLMSPRYPVPREDLEAVSAADRQSLAALRKQVEEAVVFALFKDDREFSVMAMQSLGELRSDLEARHPGTPASPTTNAVPQGIDSDHCMEDKLELLCDRATAVQAFEELLLTRADARRPGCLILFGEEDQAHPDFFARIKAHTLAGRAYRGLVPAETFDIRDLQDYYGHEQAILPYLIRGVARELEGGAQIRTFEGLYAILKRNKIALCLINCFVHVKSNREARWWIGRFEELQSGLSLEEAGPQIILSLAIDYPRRSWFLRRGRDLTRFFRKHYPAAFSGLPGPGAPEEGNGVLFRQLASATRDHVRYWCAMPPVMRRISGARINRADFLQPFESHAERPMWDVLEHLRGVLRDHPA
jgi:hypothetical protein